LVGLIVLFFNGLTTIFSLNTEHANQVISAVSSGVSMVGWALLTIIAFAAFYLLVRLMLSIAFVLEQNVNPWRAIVLSFHATRCNFWRLFGWYIAIWIIMMISIIPLGIGLIWTLPLIYISYGMIYKTL